MLEIIKRRRSSRSFDSTRPVEEAKIAEIVEAGLWAPSGKNGQKGEIIVISNKQIRDRLAEINARVGGWPAGFDPFYGAPVILLVVVKDCPYPELDGAAMIENMLLEATNQGLGTCWIHRAKAELELQETRELLKDTGLNFDEYVGVDHIALGYSLAGQPKEKAIAPGRVHYLR